MSKSNTWVSLWGKGISELKEFPFISKFHVGIKTQLMKTSKAHLHGKHYCPTIISETWYTDISTINRGWKERVPLILRGLVILFQELANIVNDTKEQLGRYISDKFQRCTVNTHRDCPSTRMQIGDAVKISNLVFAKINPCQNPMEWFSSADW